MPFVVDDDDVLGEQDGEAQAAAVMDAIPARLPLLPWTRREACRKAKRPAAILISVGVMGCEVVSEQMAGAGDEASTKSMQARRYPTLKPQGKEWAYMYCNMYCQ